MSTWQLKNEASLVSRLQDSKARQQAFIELYDALRVPIFKLIFNMIRNDALAHDALQETFLAVHRALSAFEGNASLSTWIYRIAVRTAWRVKYSHPRTENEDEIVEPLSAHLHDEVSSKIEVKRLERALALLSLEHQTVLALFAVEGMSHQEIADVLNLPVGTIWSRLHPQEKS